MLFCSFDEWAHRAGINLDRPLTSAQFSNYISGYRKTLPWAHPGQSLAYDWWAEDLWPTHHHLGKQKFIDAWKIGLAWKSKFIMENNMKPHMLEKNYFPTMILTFFFGGGLEMMTDLTIMQYEKQGIPEKDKK